MIQNSKDKTIQLKNNLENLESGIVIDQDSTRSSQSLQYSHIYRFRKVNNRVTRVQGVILNHPSTNTGNQPTIVS